MAEVINGSVRMLGDRILLRPLEWDGEAVHGSESKIAVVRHGRPLRGEVLAIGPGRHHIKYLNGRSKMVLSRYFRPTEVKAGQIVELGGLNIFDGAGYSFEEVIFNGEKCLICTERDVCGIHQDEAVA